jgi:quercetin 2,3-dioxygenase
VSDLATRPEELVCGSAGQGGPETLLLSARRVWLGKTTEVARVLPDRDIRMIGAWCFLDHYGPSDVSTSPGMQVWVHPHTGLQTVSWLLEGAVEHRDGLGSHVTVRPRELHLMTAGHGIVHSELSPADKPPTLHGVQLWVALPGTARDTAPSFSSHRELPALQRPGLELVVLLGTVAGVTSPAPTFSPLCGAQLDLAAGADVEVELEHGFEHGVFVIAGDAEVAGVPAATDQLVYLGQGRDRVRLRSEAPARLLLLGGEPFGEEIVMWWNFIGRTHEEVVAYRAAWERRDPRFAPVVSRDERVMEAPPMPTVPLKPRPRRSAR